MYVETKSRPVVLTLDIAPGTYGDGDALGVFELPQAVREAQGTGVLANISIVDKESAGPEFALIFFSGTYAAPADFVKHLGTVFVEAADVTDVSGTSFGTVGTDKTKSMVLRGDQNKSVWVHVFAKGAITTASADPFILTFGIVQD